VTRVLIIGGAGMLGHKLWQVYQDRFDTWTTLRGSPSDYRGCGLFTGNHVIPHVDAGNTDQLARVIADVRPDVIINAVGIVKQLDAARDPLTSLSINAMFPHRLVLVARLAGARVVHVSTDCVYSGLKGSYLESDPSDAEDLYGRSKYLGEVAGPGALTLRTSIIGRELKTRSGLLEWFLSQSGRRVHGYTRAIFSGLTTAAFARALAGLIEHHPKLEGLYHLSTDPISKYDLLVRLRAAFRCDVEIDTDDTVRIDRSLDSTRLQRDAGYRPESWDTMIEDLSGDPTPYDDWRRDAA
jgi:dTDP-4-dehydrorhamnose reductase